MTCDPRRFAIDTQRGSSWVRQATRGTAGGRGGFRSWVQRPSECPADAGAHFMYTHSRTLISGHIRKQFADQNCEHVERPAAVFWGLNGSGRQSRRRVRRHLTGVQWEWVDTGASLLAVNRDYWQIEPPAPLTCTQCAVLVRQKHQRMVMWTFACEWNTRHFE